MRCLFLPLTTLSTILPVVLAGGAYYYDCSCYDKNGAVVAQATQDACDAINHSDYYPADPPLSTNPRCESTPAWIINNHCFDCLCRRTVGLIGLCDGKDSYPFRFKIKCGGGC